MDTRQYRTDQPNGAKKSALNAATMDPNGTMMGHEQFGWLKDKLIVSEAKWNVLAQQVMMGMVTETYDGTESVYKMDKWPGYAYERMQLGRFLADRRIPNPVVLTGDIHSNWANELRVDDRNPDTPVVAVEFVGTSISTTGNGPAVPEYLNQLQSVNPFVKYHSKERGYARCIVTPKDWRTDFLAVEDVTKPDGKVSTRASVVVEAGKPEIHPA